MATASVVGTMIAKIITGTIFHVAPCLCINRIGMAGVAVADWKLQYEDEAETLRGYLVALFGGGPEDKPEQYANSSPVTYGERVTAPVLIIQGRNDTRCPLARLRCTSRK